MPREFPGSFADLDRACDAFEFGWTETGTRLEEFVAQAPRDERNHWFQALLEIEVEIRIRRGERPAATDYMTRFPNERAVIDRVLEGHGLLFQNTAPEARPSVTLKVISGPHLGREIEFHERDTFLVGRSKEAHFRLPKKDPYFSRHHFLLEVNPPHCQLVDLKSRNGTQVNGRFVQSASLSNGDVIRAGTTEFQVLISEPVKGSSSSASSLPEGSTKSLSPVPQPAATSILPEIRGYDVGEQLGSGGMGEVYRATNLANLQLVAIKILRPVMAVDELSCRRFLRETQILRQLRHPYIVRLLDSGRSGPILYLVMEYVPGDSLSKWVRRSPELTAVAAVELLLPVLEALSHAHAHGFVHRDVKPGNILIDEAQSKPRAKLADFGLARAYSESKLSGLTLLGDICGTPQYMAPEQITHARDAKPAADQYSAAAVLYWLLCGRRTHDFASDIQTMLLQVLQEDPVPLRLRREDLPYQLTDIVEKALKRDPADRYPSLDELIERLREFVAD